MTRRMTRTTAVNRERKRFDMTQHPWREMAFCRDANKSTSYKCLHRDAFLGYHIEMDQTLTTHIESKATVCGGKPCIAGTRIRVQDIYVWHELQGQSADEIVS